MFVARTIAGYRVCTLEQSKNELQPLAKNGELMCPVCHEEVRYWSQTDNVRPHFKHKSKENCLEDKYGENETIEHQNGKYLLFKHMKGLYPESKVELEYQIKETQQRSDVMVIHPNGEKWAIEFQCAPISKDDWSKRHQLYKSVGIKAFWILGMSVLQRNKEKKSPLENTIYQDNQRVLYLDALTEKVILHERFLYRFDGIHFDVIPDVSITSNISAILIQPEKGPGAIQEFPSHEMRLSLSIQELNKFYEKQEEKFRNHLTSSMENIHVEEELAKQQEQEQTKQNKAAQKAYFQNLMVRRHNLLNDLTDKEAELFRTLTKKYQLTPDNFPGLFLLTTEGHEHIETPSQLWQLWLYDQLFETTSYSRVPWDVIEQNFVDKMLKRVFRAQILGKKFAIPLHKYRFQLNKIGLIEFLGELKELVHPLDFLIDNHRDNILLQMHWEGIWENYSRGGIPDQWESQYRKKSPYQKKLEKYFSDMVKNLEKQ